MTSLLTLMLLTGPLASAASVSTWFFNEAGVRELTRGDKGPAYKSFARALDGESLDVRVQMNLALTFEANEEFEKAINAYEGVLSLMSPDDPLRPAVLFNLGNANARAKRAPAAVKAYQQALDAGADPKTVKTNIELLFKGGGGGDGQGQSKSDPKDQKDPKDDDKKKDDRTNQEKREDSLKKPDPEKEKDKDKDKGKPKPFQSQELTPEDVKRILDEIKNQEQSIRAQENDKQPKDAARGGKDW